MEPPLQKSKSERNRTSISKLPADIIHCILTLLPIKEAAKTSLLSREWRYRWRSIPDLVFDRDFATIPDIDDPGSARHNKVMLTIFQILLVHDVPINKFELDIPVMSDCPHMNQLVDYLKMKNVKELAILLYSDRDAEFLPSLVFSLDLNSLKLMGFTVVEPTWSAGFRNLIFLELEDLVLPVNFFESFLPKCPLLEELRVSYCGKLSAVFVSPSLKVLFLECWLDSISFKYTPLLTALEIGESGLFNDNNEIQDHDMVALFAALPALQQLKLGIDLLLLLCFRPVPYKLPASLLELEVLEIPRILFGKLPEMRVLVCLIMSSPNLRKLTIVHDKGNGTRPEFEDTDSLQTLLEPEDHSEVCCLQRLEEFTIQQSRGTLLELELIRFVLATAPLLKRISITPKKGLSSETVTKFLAELTRTKTVKELGLLFPAGELEELLPSSVFALDLNSLKLMGMTVVEPPWSVGFRNLTFLELKEQILPVNWFESFLPKCPLLEELRVSDCNAVSPVFVAPSLKVLFFESMLVSICFKYTPLLSVLTVIEVRESAQFESFLDYSEAQNTEMVAQFAALPALQQLKLGLKLLRLFCDGHVPSKLPASLPNLKVLEIPCVLLGNLQEMRVLVCLIMSSPNLQRLTIVHDDEDERHPDCEVIDSLQMLLEPEDHNGVSCLQRLEKLSIHNGSGTRVELELAKFVLATAPVLKTVFIEPKKGLSSEIVTEFLVELTQFKRISKEAEVKYASRKLDKA
ncbi:F-box/FBD/LRR-repeat protein At1g13570 [Linum grandiflorum]